MSKYYHRQCGRVTDDAGHTICLAELQLLMPDGKLHFLLGSFPEGDPNGIRFTAASDTLYDLMIGKAEEVDEDIVYYASWRGLTPPEGSGYEQAAAFLTGMVREKYGIALD
jgi:hypothetical protein